MASQKDFPTCGGHATQALVGLPKVHLTFLFLTVEHFFYTLRISVVGASSSGWPPCTHHQNQGPEPGKERAGHGPANNLGDKALEFH